MAFKIEIEQEEDGRWVAEVVEFLGVMVYSKTLDEATFSGYQTIAIFGHLCHEIMSHWGKNNVFCT